MTATDLFLKRPVLATIVNLMIVFIGGLCFQNLTFREYPDIELPYLTVDAIYPNASAEVMETTVTTYLEDALAKVEGLDYISSETEYQHVSIRLQFKEGVSVDRCMILTRDALNKAKHDLPTEVKEPIVRRSNEQQDGPPFMAILLQNHNKSLLEVYHFANAFLKNSLKSVKGVADISLWGEPPVMEIQFDPKKLSNFGLNVDDLFNALDRGNLSYPAGRLHDRIPVSIDMNLSSPEQFGGLLIKKMHNKEIFLKDVASITLRSKGDDMRFKFNGERAINIAVVRANDANPLDVSRDIRKEIEKLKQTLPKDYELTVMFDQTDFIQASLKNVKSAIFEAIFLVLLIIYLFLGTFRATLIPIITIPIALIGGFIILNAFGYSLNTISLLAMVLAIGLVVDDAIVVLENIYRHIEEGMQPFEAALKGAREIGFAIIAMTLTLASVYIPIFFIQGFLGRLLMEFAITLAGTVIVSGITALTLSPIMCSKLLKSQNQQSKHVWFEKYFEKLQDGYLFLFDFMVKNKRTIWSVIVGICVINVIFFKMLPQDIVPREDRGFVGVFMPNVAGKNADDMEKYADDVLKTLPEVPEAVAKLVFLGRWGASAVFALKDHHDRSRSAEAIKTELQGKAFQIPSIDVWAWSWDIGLPNVDSKGSDGDVSVAVQTLGSYHELSKQLDVFRNKLDETQFFKEVYHQVKLNYPSYDLILDRYLLGKSLLSPDKVSHTIQTYLSGNLDRSFLWDNLSYEIYLRPNTDTQSLSEVTMYNDNGKSVALSVVGKLQPTSVPASLKHYNQIRAGSVAMNLKPGEMIGDAIKQFEIVAAEHLPQSLRYEWQGAAKTFMESSSQLILLILAGFIFIYAILAIQFESFLDPFIILLAVPLAAIGALAALFLTGGSINIYTQVGLLSLIGLIAKHGILIVEFSNHLLEEEGINPLEAVRKACLLRLRPILMTTLAMVLGVVPLMVASGAGAESRRAVGLVLFGGLSIGTLLTIIVVPFFYILLKTQGRD